MRRLSAAVFALLALSGCSVEQIIRTIFPDNGDEAVSVAHCESRLQPGAVGGSSFGTFQIHSVHAPNFEAVTGKPWAEGWHDPIRNTAFAKWLWDREGWSPWAAACRP